MMRRSLYLGLGFTCLLLGLIGVILPLLPTTPFVILAAFCFSRSSEKFHRMLLDHRFFGPMISDWEAYGIIPLKVKCLSSSMMLVMISYPILFKDLAWWIDATMATTALIGLGYVWSKPSERLTKSSS